MGGHEVELEGPDLAAGVALATVVSKGQVLGHAHGEPVLLIHLDGDCVAVSAHCPHYGAPLAEGALVGKELRCPWHHAAFDLETGVAKAPSLSPLSCWRTEIVGEQVFVREKKDVSSGSSRAIGANQDVKDIVIVGAGAAGNAAAEALRSLGYEGSLTVLSADEDRPYDRPNLSKDYLAGNAPEEWIPLRSEEFYRDGAIDLRLGTRVTSLDPSAKTVTTAGGDVIPFDRCLLATGAEPIRLGTLGSDQPHVFYLRTLGDCRKLIAGIESAKGNGSRHKALVIGSGFIGLEVACSLRARDYGVTVVSRDALPLERVVGREVGRYLLELHKENGVDFRLEAEVQSIARDHVVLADGSRVEADLVVVGIGVKPDLSLAEKAGLALAGGGIRVDQTLRTSSPDIFAAGDLACWPLARGGAHARIEHWVVAGRQGQLAAKNMLGAQEPYGAVPFFWTVQHGVGLAYVGHASRWDEIRIVGDLSKGDAAICYLEKGRVMAAATIGRDQMSLAVEAALEAGDDARLKELFPDDARKAE